MKLLYEIACVQQKKQQTFGSFDTIYLHKQTFSNILQFQRFSYNFLLIILIGSMYSNWVELCKFYTFYNKITYRGKSVIEFITFFVIMRNRNFCTIIIDYIQKHQPHLLLFIVFPISLLLFCKENPNRWKLVISFELITYFNTIDEYAILWF